MSRVNMIDIGQEIVDGALLKIPIFQLWTDRTRNKNALQNNWNAICKTQDRHAVDLISNLYIQRFGQTPTSYNLVKIKQLAGSGDVPGLHGLNIIRQFVGFVGYLGLRYISP